ncbi:MAG: ABC transporter ATP-binding protein [Cyanobacteria bacterium P01_E01_bin.45]
MATAIALDRVEKRFGEQAVVRDLSLEIEAGELFGLLGPNGAGKSTTVRMLTTLTKPSSGTIQVRGLDVVRQQLQVRADIGVVVQPISLNSDRTVWENLEFHGRLHHLPRQVRQDRIDRWLGYVELSERRDDLVKTLSGGMKRRLQIARSLMHEPEILFLDEPTVGLDPQARRLLWDIIRSLNARGMTILLTTHYMEEAESLCDRIGIMDRGQLIAVGTPTELRQRQGEVIVERQAIGGEASGDIGSQVTATQHQFFPTLTEATAYLDAQTDKTGLMVRPSNLEDIFMQLTGRGLD